MNQYQQMKQTGIRWIKEIPDSWSVRALFQLGEQVKNKNVGLSETNLLSLSYGKIKRKDINNREGLLPESFEGYNRVEANDIVLRLTDLQNDHTSLRVGQAMERGIVTSAYITIRPSAIVNARYLYFVLHAYDLIKGFYGMGSGVRQSLNYDEVKTLKIPFPDLITQGKIGEYLDDYCGQIDILISEASATLSDYKKWKFSLIHEAVTKGIVSNQKLKDSNIDWVGKIPEHWETIPNKRIMRKKKDICEKWNGEDVMSLTMNGVIVRNLVNPTGKMPATFDGYQHIEEGDLLMCLFDIDVTPRCVGRVKHSGVTSPAYSRFELLDNADLGYYYYYYLMVDNTKELLHLAKNLRHSFTEDQLGALHVPFPPIEEQKQIAEYLDKKMQQIDSFTKEKQDLINNLETFKRALVFEAVTGKRKVV